MADHGFSPRTVSAQVTVLERGQDTHHDLFSLRYYDLQSIVLSLSCSLLSCLCPEDSLLISIGRADSWCHKILLVFC